MREPMFDTVSSPRRLASAIALDALLAKLRAACCIRSPNSLVPSARVCACRARYSLWHCANSCGSFARASSCPNSLVFDKVFSVSAVVCSRMAVASLSHNLPPSCVADIAQFRRAATYIGSNLTISTTMFSHTGHSNVHLS